MRVIAGVARGRPLRAPNLPGLRPTLDLVRGAIFDMIGPYFPEDLRVLDLYAGSGALGIEALSRGAGFCDFVEQQRRCCAAIRENLQATGLQEQARVHNRSVVQALPSLTGPYGLVLMDPPYALAFDGSIPDALLKHRLVEPGARLVVEHSSRALLLERYDGFVRTRDRRHGDTTVSIYSLEGAAVGASNLPRDL